MRGKIGFVILFGLALVGCRTPDVPLFTVQDFQNQTPTPVAVATVQVLDSAERFTELPHIETRIPVVPSYALQRALNHRFAAAAPTSRDGMEIVVEEASLIQTYLPSPEWYVQNNMEYMLRYRVRVVYTRAGRPLETQTITGWEKQALPKRSSLVDKETAWAKMLNAMITKVADKIQTDLPPDLAL